ncbi:unnamed protein product [Closterium sp. Yama58-4]|nr:unnamed protein product [Closterium sp. Yama58-4]
MDGGRHYESLIEKMVGAPAFEPELPECDDAFLAENNVYSSRDKCLDAVEEYALFHGFGIYSETVRKNYALIICKATAIGWTPACEWHCVYGKDKESGLWVITTLDDHRVHTCPPHLKARGARSLGNRVAVLYRLYGNLVRADPFLPPKTICAQISALKGPIVNYHQAYRLRELIKTEVYGDWHDSFRLFPTLAARFKEIDPQSSLKILTLNGHFHRIFVSPSASRVALQHCRPVVTLDGTFLLSAQRASLLIAVVLDGNQEIILLAWSLVESENKDSWTWFLDLFTKTFPEWIQRENAAIISDRDKGLVPAAKEFLPDSIPHYFCGWHLDQNIRWWGTDAKIFFWRLLKARLLPKWKALMREARVDFSEMAEYLFEKEEKPRAPPVGVGTSAPPPASNPEETTQEARARIRLRARISRRARAQRLRQRKAAQRRAARTATGGAASVTEEEDVAAGTDAAAGGAEGDVDWMGRRVMTLQGMGRLVMGQQERPLRLHPTAVLHDQLCPPSLSCRPPFDIDDILLSARFNYFPGHGRRHAADGVGTTPALLPPPTDPAAAGAATGTGATGAEIPGGTDEDVVGAGLDFFTSDENGYSNPSTSRPPRAEEDDGPARAQTGFHQNKAGSKYRIGIHPKHWARVYARTARYGIYTSNAAESVNSAIRPIRQLPPVYLVAALWDWYRKKMYERGARARARGEYLTDKAMKRLADKRERSKNYKVTIGGPGYGTVRTLGSRDFAEWRSFNVDLRPGKKTCECGNWKEYAFPCSHVVAFCREMQTTDMDHVSDFYTTATLCQTYSGVVHGSCVDLLIAEMMVPLRGVCEPPQFKRCDRGRPRTVRRMEGQAPKQKYGAATAGRTTTTSRAVWGCMELRQGGVVHGPESWHHKLHAGAHDTGEEPGREESEDEGGAWTPQRRWDAT